jgi:hypothetical protein
MKTTLRYAIFTAILTLCLSVISQAAAFTIGNLVVCRAGAIGGGALSSAAAPVFLDEYTTAGALVQSIALPVADSGLNQTLTVSGSSTSECLLTRSADGRYLFITGYDAAPATAAPNTVSSATIQRVIGRVGNDGIVDTSTTTTAFSAQNIRGAVSDNGTNIWMTGSGTGVVFTTLGGSGAGTVVQNAVVNLRSINIFDGQLYTTSMSGAIRLASVGAGLPTTTGQVLTNLPGFPTTGSLNSPYEYFFADLTPSVAGLDTVYVADDSGSLGGLQKYSLVGGNWTLNGTAVTPGIRGLTGIVNFTPGAVVTLYATGTATNANTLSVYSDTSGYNARPTPADIKSSRGGELVPGAPAVIATASVNTAFRGVAFAPLLATAATATISGRVTDNMGRPLANAQLILAGGDLPHPVTVFTGMLGYYSFTDLTAGQNYVISVSAKRHRFDDPSQVVNLKNDQEMNFVANQ